MAGKILKCPLCGASEVEKKHDMLYECRYCNTLFRLPDDGNAKISLERGEEPLFTCVSCHKPYFAEDWQNYSKHSFQTSKSPLGKKIAVNYDILFCPNCRGYVCIRCASEGRMKRFFCAKCENKLEKVSGSFVVSDLKEAPEMFRKVFYRNAGKY
ncbi:MAG: hypothetical protein JW825_03045 [Candidatus Methanofastidiosa archaeon]|nr:hypothetical protein [Candidatus Methanofastidiosa archaeon]